MIYINAPIGIGKSSLTYALAKDTGYVPFYEDISKIPTLNGFYDNGSKSREDKSFSTQIAFLNFRFKQLQQGQKLEEQGTHTIFDSSLASDSLMARNLYNRGEMPENLYNLYIELNQNMVNSVASHGETNLPDLYIYLDAPFEMMLDHIQHRGRQMEQDKSLVPYYKDVHEIYKNWYKSCNTAKVLRIDMRKYDFVNNHDDLTKVLDKIENELISLGKMSTEEYHNIINNRNGKVFDFTEIE